MQNAEKVRAVQINVVRAQTKRKIIKRMLKNRSAAGLFPIQIVGEQVPLGMEQKSPCICGGDVLFYKKEMDR